MANCIKCSAVVAEDSAFCGTCGQPVQTPAAPPVATSNSVAAASNAVVVGGASSGASSAGVGLTMNLAAALSYALGLITGILFLVLDPYKNNKFVRFHAIQSVIFTAAVIVFWIVWSILSGILVDVAGFWLLAVEIPLDWLLGLAIFVFWLYLMFQAYSNREYQIPFIGPIAAKQVH